MKGIRKLQIELEHAKHTRLSTAGDVKSCGAASRNRSDREMGHNSELEAYAASFIPGGRESLAEIWR